MFSSDKETWLNLFSVWSINIDPSFTTKVYYGDLSLVGIHNMDKYVSRPMENPIILFDNTLQQINESQAGSTVYYAYSTMYNIPEQEFNQFIQEYQLSDQIMAQSNVLDVYEYNWATIYCVTYYYRQCPKF